MARARRHVKRCRQRGGPTVAGAVAAIFAGIVGYVVIEGVLLELPHWAHLALTVPCGAALKRGRAERLCRCVDPERLSTSEKSRPAAQSRRRRSCRRINLRREKREECFGASSDA